MRDTLIIAVSQSGTTTDTNRTVDLLRSRGAHIIAIVNRRNSDLVFKANDVIYTSDGRDIEMSVASTKAFYSQNTAGQLLALSLAESLGTMTSSELREAIESIHLLPEVMKTTLKLSPQIKSIAGRFAPNHRYWAIVGTGAGRIAADEIRIKLSELCYKAIAVDFIEDKKHIDLSSEPLIIVCANQLTSNQIADAVKEIAIFKAHSSIPIVITEEGENRFDPYAASCIKVPKYGGVLSFLIPTMVGHLFGYYAADAFEQTADKLRTMRKSIVKTALKINHEEPDPDDAKELDSPRLINESLKVQELLSSGKLDSALETSSAVKLNEILNFIMKRINLDLLPVQFNRPGTVKNLLNLASEIISDTIGQVSRPIDAIKHQAKTVTVGISRTERIVYEGPIWHLINELNLKRETVPTNTVTFLNAFGSLLKEISGSTLYEIRGLNPLGQPIYETELKTVHTEGIAKDFTSRYNKFKPLLGTKREVVREKRFYLGLGQKDLCKILILPFITEAERGELLLLHLKLKPHGELNSRIRALKAYQNHYNNIVADVTELDIPWSDNLISGINNSTLFMTDPKEAASQIANSISFNRP